MIEAEAAVAMCTARWHALCERLHVLPAQCEQWWGHIHSSYEGPGRYYHTLAHVAELLAHLDEHRDRVHDASAIELAVFFHDIVYDAETGGGGKNERESAAVFLNFVKEVAPSSGSQTVSADRQEKVARWILQTKDHQCADNDELDCKLFMDIDMAILGAPATQYDAYAASVRREYGHLSTLAWAYGRSAFLSSFASGSKPIFATEAFRSRFEAAARRNAAHEALALRVNLAAIVLLALVIAILFVLSLFLPLCHLRVCARWACGACSLPLGVWMCTRYEAFPYGRPLVTEASASSASVAVFAGSLNPPHHGHMGIIRHLASTHASVHVVIGHNRNKVYQVTPQQRKEMAETACSASGLSNVTVHVTDDYIWRLARRFGARVLYRGIRSWSQDGPAERWLEMLNIGGPIVLAFAPPLRTHYLQADPRYAHVSSSLVRRRCIAGEAIDDVVPAAIAEQVLAAYGTAGEPGKVPDESSASPAKKVQ